MPHDREIVDAIKAHFARRSMGQLQVIARGDGGDHWSPEAAVAAREVLQDRLAGRAQEPPQVPDEEDEPPEYHFEPWPAELWFLAGLLTGSIIIPYYRRAERPDLPVPFGPRMAWLALDTTDTEAVATALGLRGARHTPWGQGIEAAHQGSVFVTPPVGDWTLAVGTPLVQPLHRTAAILKPLLEQLGRRFTDAQYFCNHQDVAMYVWARARRGRLIRGYGWLGTQGRTLWEEGALTKEERDLGFRLGAGQPPQVDPGDGTDLVPFSEDRLFQLACYWSIDPTTLDQEYKEPVSGLLGTIML
jgi:hypothetical protein